MSLEIDSGMELEKFEAHDRMEKPFHIDVGSHNAFISLDWLSYSPIPTSLVWKIEIEFKNVCEKWTK